MISEGQVGIQILNDGSTQPFRMTKLAAMVVQELHGRYYEQSYRANTFVAATQVGVTTTSLNATATGFILTNPAGSGRNMVLLDLSITTTAVPAALSYYSLAANVNIVAAAVVQTTPLIVRPALLGSAASAVGLAAQAATLPVAPVIIRAIGGGVYAAAATGSLPFIRDEIAGSIIMAPGTAVSLSASSAAFLLVSMMWEEVPI